MGDGELEWWRSETAECWSNGVLEQWNVSDC
jgi:hypothetical protein